MSGFGRYQQGTGAFGARGVRGGTGLPQHHLEAAARQRQPLAANRAVSGQQIYTQLMNGVSHMLPFVVGGGIPIAIAFLIDGFSVDMNALPLDQRVNFGTITRWRHGLKCRRCGIWLYAPDSGWFPSRWRSETARRWQSVLSAV